MTIVNELLMPSTKQTQRHAAGALTGTGFLPVGRLHGFGDSRRLQNKATATWRDSDDDGRFTRLANCMDWSTAVFRKRPAEAGTPTAQIKIDPAHRPFAIAGSLHTMDA
jgi:hypothetical protein